METGNKQQISLILRGYKTPNGVIKFDKVLAIPTVERIPVLAQNDFTKTVTIISAALTLAFESLNLKRPMTGSQSVDLAEDIIETSNEDNLALEDLMLFLQKFVRGEYGANYESMDRSKFMIAFENYRELRHQQLHSIKYEQAAQYKVMGDAGRTGEVDELSQHFSNFADKISGMNNELKATRKENIELKKNIK